MHLDSDRDRACCRCSVPTEEEGAPSRARVPGSVAERRLEPAYSAAASAGCSLVSKGAAAASPGAATPARRFSAGRRSSNLADSSSLFASPVADSKQYATPRLSTEGTCQPAAANNVKSEKVYKHVPHGMLSVTTHRVHHSHSALLLPFLMICS